MKIYSVDFEPLWPVPCGLIIVANSKDEAKEIALKALGSLKLKEIKECDISQPGIIFFENGDY